LEEKFQGSAIKEDNIQEEKEEIMKVIMQEKTGSDESSLCEDFLQQAQYLGHIQLDIL
jgi:hypothetical protein